MSAINVRTQGAELYVAERRGCYDHRRPAAQPSPTLGQLRQDNRRMILEGFPIRVVGSRLEVFGPMLRQILRNKRVKPGKGKLGKGRRR